MQLTFDFVLKVCDDIQQINETDGASKNMCVSVHVKYGQVVKWSILL